MKTTQKLLLVLLISTTVLSMKNMNTQLEGEASEQTSLLLNGAQKLLSQKNGSSNSKIENFAQKVFNKVDVKKEIFLPTTDTSNHIVKKSKFIEIDVDHNQAPNKDSNLKNIKLLNMYHQHHAPGFKSPIVKGSKKMLGRMKGKPFTELAMAVQKGSQYSRHLHNYFNTQYTAKFAVGDKKDEFSFILDTGSGTTLLNDYRCQSAGC